MFRDTICNKEDLHYLNLPFMNFLFKNLIDTLKFTPIFNTFMRSNEGIVVKGVGVDLGERLI